MFEKALLPLDLSEVNEKLVEKLESFKKIGLREITLLHVIEEDLVKKIESKTGIGGLREILEAKAEEKLEEYRRKLSEKGFVAKIYKPLPYGKVDEEVLGAVEREKTDFMILTSKGENWFKRSLLGSTSETLLKRSTIPVFYIKVVFRDKTYELNIDNPTKRILVATDLSENAFKLYQCAMDIASRTKSPIYLLHVIEYYRAPENLVRLGREELERIVDMFERKGLKTYYSVRKGVPYKEIIEFTEEHDITMIVMGDKGKESFISGLLMGSTVDAVVRHSKVPLLICK